MEVIIGAMQTRALAPLVCGDLQFVFQGLERGRHAGGVGLQLGL